MIQTAFGHEQMYIRFETDVAAESMDGIDHTDTCTGRSVVDDFACGSGSNLQEEFQQRLVDVGERPQDGQKHAL